MIRPTARATPNSNVRTLVRLAAPYCRPRTPFASPPPRRAGANHLVLLADLRRSSFMACTITSLIGSRHSAFWRSGSLTCRGSAHGCEKRRPGDQRGPDRWRPQHVAAIGQAPVPAIDDELRLFARGPVRLQLAAPALMSSPSCSDAHGASIEAPA
jgi:hypothetical protein